MPPLSDPHVAVLAFPFSTHAAPLLTIINRLASSSPNTLFSFFSTAQSNNSIFSTSQPTQPNIKAYNVHDGVPGGYVFVGKPQEDIELFMELAPDNFRKGMEVAVAETGRKVSCLVTDAFFWFAKEMAVENGVPWLAFWTAGPCSLSSHVYTDLIREKFGVGGIVGREDETLNFIPGMTKIRIRDLPEGVLFGNLESLFSRMLHQMGQVLPDADAVFINSFEELDPVMTNDFKSKFKQYLNVVLKLGGQGDQGYPISQREMKNWEGTSGKKTKLSGGSGNCAVCQVEDCGADLSNAKDYHRRHKVCEMHSKASKALVGNVMQRFCQQCSRFHVLQEFDEGKRSCRRRLAGHNKRRRKTNPETVVKGNSLNDEQTSGYLLLSLLRILSGMHSNRSEQTTDQDVLSHLLRSLANHTGEQVGRNITGLLPEPQDSEAVLALFLNGQGPPRPFKQQITEPASEMPQKGVRSHDTTNAEVQGDTTGAAKMNNFDLNDIYIDSDDGADDIEEAPAPLNTGTSFLDCPSWVQQDSHQSSPPQTSGNSDSASAQSPSSSSGDGQSRTDRIVFKLFGKEPNDFPLVLRAQILDWLSHSPTDIESYIRPGCIVLTIYLRQLEAAWDELCCDLSFSLSQLLDCSDDTFWRTGWICIRVQDQIAFIYNGQIVVDASLPLRSSQYSKIMSVKPIAVSATERAQFLVKGINLSRPATRLLCAVEGKYLVQEATHELIDDIDDFKEQDELQCINFSCSIPTVTGRGFIEIEDDGYNSSFFPFIVAEDDVCLEIRMLESILEIADTEADVDRTGKIEAKNQAMDFIHEVGWLLHRSQLKSRLGNLDPNPEPFPLRRFKWLMEFSMDHEWCAVVKKLLNILLDGTVGSGEYPSLDLALTEMGLLHRAVRKNCKPLVELLLRFVPDKTSDRLGFENDMFAGGIQKSFLFRPDVLGPAGLTPLHIAAGKDGSEDVLDALTDDPGKVGIDAWKSARDSSGSTPEDYARLRGHYSYIHLVQKKINKRPPSGHVVVNIPCALSDCSSNQKQTNESTSSFEIGQLELRYMKRHCKLCDQKLAYGYGTASRSLVYRPAMLSMVAIAAVCVCVALLFKSCPEVLYVFRPFRWELLEYGAS